MTMQNLLQQCRKKSHSKVRRFWVVLAAVALLLVLACRGYDWDALGRYKGITSPVCIMCAAALWKCCGMIPSPTSWTLPAAWHPGTAHPAAGRC